MTKKMKAKEASFATNWKGKQKLKTSRMKNSGKRIKTNDQ